MEWEQTAFAKRVSETLTNRGWTQKTLAEKLKKPPGTVSGWLTSEQNKPSLQVVCDVADQLKVREEWLAFGDPFEPMDDEELKMITAWRKLTDAERGGFLQALEAVAGARPQTKKPGQRTKRAQSLASTHNTAAQSASLLQQAETIERILADLLLHEALLPVGSKAQISVENASTLLDQLVASLRSAQQRDQQTDSAASSPTEGRASGKPQQGHTQSRLPLSSPTDEKS